MSNGVIVAHPGRQHSHQLALSIYKVGLLKKYCSSIPARRGIYCLIPKKFWKNYDYYDLDIPTEYLNYYLFMGTVLNKCVAKFTRRDFYKYIENIMLDHFDSCIATHLYKMKAKVIIAYENASQHTFKSAARLGMVKILDAASVHYTFQDQYSKLIESSKLHKQIIKKKEEEIQYADIILTTSQFARQTYLNAGILPQKVIAIPLGVDLLRFKPLSQEFNSRNFVRFVFCGTYSHHKGLDLLLSAYQKIRNFDIEFELVLVGNMSVKLSLGKDKKSIYQLGKLSQQEFAAVLQNSDCLILPSRYDSFGMVVLEALACGLPVIVSDAVGAKEAVSEGINGWIISSNDVELLVERMLWCINNPKKVRDMGKAARISAQEYSWDSYQKKIINLIREML